MGCYVSKVSYRTNNKDELAKQIDQSPPNQDNSEEERFLIGGTRLSTPRITSLPMDALPTDVKRSLDRLPADSFKNKYAPSNVLGTIAKSDKVAASFLDHWVSSKKLMDLSNREQELIILRMAVHYRSDYVWKHHVIIGKEFGITDAQLKALQQIPFIVRQEEGFSSRDLGLIAFTDDFNIIRTVSNETWQNYNRYFKESEIIDAILVASHYVFFALINNSLCVDIEPALDEIPRLSSP
jgi:4-carboxymuconolactone decarboxylase